MSNACNAFGLTITIQKTKIVAIDIEVGDASSVNIHSNTLNVVDSFTYLGSIMVSNLSLDKSYTDV